MPPTGCWPACPSSCRLSSRCLSPACRFAISLPDICPHPVCVPAAHPFGLSSPPSLHSIHNKMPTKKHQTECYKSEEKHCLSLCRLSVCPPVTLNPITKRHACAGSPLLASSIPILLAPHADLALLQANSIKTMHPRPDPHPSCLHKTSKYTLVACLSFACLSVRLSPDCLRPACPCSCRLPSWCQKSTTLCKPAKTLPKNYRIQKIEAIFS